MSGLSGIFGGKLGDIIYVEDDGGSLYSQVPGSELVLVRDAGVTQVEFRIVYIDDLPQPVQSGLGCTLVDVEELYE